MIDDFWGNTRALIFILLPLFYGLIRWRYRYWRTTFIDEDHIIDQLCFLHWTNSAGTENLHDMLEQLGINILIQSLRRAYLHTQQPSYPYEGAFLHHPYSPQTTPHSPLAHMLLPSSNPHAPSHIPQQPTQGITPPQTQMLRPQPQPF